jgi:hypothetical protein
MISEVILCYYWYFLSFLNQTGISQYQLMLIFVIVLLVPINLEHTASTQAWTGQVVRPPCGQTSDNRFQLTTSMYSPSVS